MVKTSVTMTIDNVVKDRALQILQKRGDSLSGYVEKKLREVVENDNRRK